MGKHSKNLKDKKNKLKQTIRIVNTEDFKKIKQSKNKIDPQDIKNNNRGKKIKKVKIKRPPSKLKKFLFKLILILFFITAIIVGICQGVEAAKWQILAKQMCNNTCSTVVDLKRKYYCYSWLTKNS